MRAIGQALDAYARKFGAFPPQSQDWESLLLAEGLTDQSRLICPVRQVDGFHYHYVEPPTGDASHATQTPILFEDLEAHWRVNANVLFADYQVRNVKPDEYQGVIAKSKR